jgi:DNA-nicking Smr family endonuclease
MEKVSRNAMNDIFEQVNSRGSKGVENESGIYKVDFHGLHVNDAKSILEDYVFLCLPVLEKVMIVTGCGLKQKLKKQMLAYLKSLKYETEEVFANNGAFYLLKNK